MKKELSSTELCEMAHPVLGLLSPKGMEMLSVVNGEGEVVGCAPRSLCHLLGIRHMVVYLIIIAPDGKTLIQVRSDGRYDVSVGGHVNISDEDSESAVVREAIEEVGLEVSGRMRLVDRYEYDEIKNGTINSEYRIVYDIVVDTDELKVSNADPLEVASLEWMSMREVGELDRSVCAGGLRSLLERGLIRVDPGH